MLPRCSEALSKSTYGVFVQPMGQMPPSNRAEGLCMCDDPSTKSHEARCWTSKGRKALLPNEGRQRP